MLFVAVLGAALPDAKSSLAKHWSGRQPADQPVKESEEKEKASGAAEFGDVDDSVAAGIVTDGDRWNCHTWAARDLAIDLFRRVHQHRADHCRAPPISVA